MKIINTTITTLRLLSAWGSAKQVPIEAFSAGVNYGNVKLSPDGDYLSFTSEIEGRKRLVVLDLNNNKIINSIIN